MARPSPLRPSLALGAVTLAVLAGCSERPAKPGPLQARSDAAVSTACAGTQTCVSTDAHAKHQAAGFDCITCHPCGAQYGFRVGFAFAGGTTIRPTDTLTRGNPPTCTVACHYPMGSPAKPVSWSAPAPLACVGCHDVPTLLARLPVHPEVSPTATRAACEACHVVGDLHTSGTVQLVGHPASWMVRTDPGFHAIPANRGIAACQACHAQNLAGGKTGVGCASCHRAGGTANDFARCNACHGQAGATGAPPPAIWGYAGDPARGGGTADPVRVGAHTAHVTEGQFGPAFGCEVCHVKPAAITSLGHIDTVAQGADPLARVDFSGLAVNGAQVPPAWTRGTATCASTYCHGATLDATPGGVKNPTWTGGSSQVFCGSCHGVPTPTPHVSVDVTNGFGVCSPCHSFTVDGAGHVIPASQGGKHLNGLLEASGHDAAWMDPQSATFHAFSANRGIQNCTPCHGADLAGGSVRSACSQCHRAGGQAPDFATCTACHGGEDNSTGAPPAAIWGYAGDPLRGGGTLDPVRVGAHTKHLAPTRSAPFDCAVCHVKPAGILSTGHIDDPTPLATVTFGGIADDVPAGSAPAWTRGTASCAATYCHGNYAGTYVYDAWDWGADAPITMYASYSGKKATASWTGGPVTCASCHGDPPTASGTWHSRFHGNRDSHRQCQTCHPDASSTTGSNGTITNPALHVNGIVEVTPRWDVRCFNCH